MKIPFTILFCLLISISLFAQRDTNVLVLNNCIIENIPIKINKQDFEDPLAIFKNPTEIYYVDENIIKDTTIINKIKIDLKQLEYIILDKNKVSIDAKQILNNYKLIYYKYKRVDIPQYEWSPDVGGQSITIRKIESDSLLFQNINYTLETQTQINAWKFDCFLIIIINDKYIGQYMDMYFFKTYYFKIE